MRMIVACGGSGDLVTALSLVLSGARQDTVVLATPVWERFALDPHPGPRDHHNIKKLARDKGGWRITQWTNLPGGFSPLPRFAAACGLPLMFLSLSHGVVGLTAQLDRIARSYGTSDVDLVDTGGDVLARGDEPGLVSPALDAALLAALANLPCATSVTCAGLGLDGELTEMELVRLIREIPPQSADFVTCTLASEVYRRFSWFPSEASLMMLLAAMGCEGTVDVSDKGHPVVLDDRASVAYSFSLPMVAERSTLARVVAGCKSFTDLDAALQAQGSKSEYASEVSRGTRQEADKSWQTENLRNLICRQRIQPNADFVTARRIARSVGLNSRRGYRVLHRYLASTYGPDYQRPLLRSNALLHAS